MSQRDAYIAKMELQLDKLNAKINELESTTQQAKEDAQNKYKEEMTKLRHQSKLAVAKLDELKATNEDSWESMVNEMEKMHEAFTHSFFSLFQMPNISGSQAPADKSGPTEAAKKRAH